MAYNSETKKWDDVDFRASGKTVTRWSRVHRWLYLTGGSKLKDDESSLSAVFKLWAKAAAAGDSQSSHFGVVSWWSAFENFILK